MGSAEMPVTGENEGIIASGGVEAQPVNAPAIDPASLLTLEEQFLAQEAQRNSRLNMPKQVKEGVWQLTDMKTGEVYYAKRVSPSEKEMTLRASGFEGLPADSIIKLPQVVSTDLNGVPEQVRDVIEDFKFTSTIDRDRSEIILMRGAPKGAGLYVNDEATGMALSMLGNRPITPAEYDRLTNDVKLLNDNGIVNNDLINNVNLRRDAASGRLEAYTFDFDHLGEPSQDIAHLNEARTKLSEQGIIRNAPDASIDIRSHVVGWNPVIQVAHGYRSPEITVSDFTGHVTGKEARSLVNIPMYDLLHDEKAAMGQIGPIVADMGINSKNIMPLVGAQAANLMVERTDLGAEIMERFKQKAGDNAADILQYKNKDENGRVPDFARTSEVYFSDRKNAQLLNESVTEAVKARSDAGQLIRFDDNMAGQAADVHNYFIFEAGKELHKKELVIFTYDRDLMGKEKYLENIISGNFKDDRFIAHMNIDPAIDTYYADLKDQLAKRAAYNGRGELMPASDELAKKALQEKIKKIEDPAAMDIARWITARDDVRVAMMNGDHVERKRINDDTDLVVRGAAYLSKDNKSGRPLAGIELPIQGHVHTTVEELSHQAINLRYNNEMKPYTPGSAEEKKFISDLRADMKDAGGFNKLRDDLTLHGYSNHTIPSEVPAKIIAMKAAGTWTPELAERYPRMTEFTTQLAKEFRAPPVAAEPVTFKSNSTLTSDERKVVNAIGIANEALADLRMQPDGRMGAIGRAQLAVILPQEPVVLANMQLVNIDAESLKANASRSARSLGVSEEAVVEAARVAQKAGEQKNRHYHDVEHFATLEQGSRTIAGALEQNNVNADTAKMMGNAYSVAARDHDVVYLNADGKMLPEVEAKIGKYFQRDAGGNYNIAKGVDGENIKIAMETFGYKEGQKLNPFSGRNEFLSAVYSLEANEGMSAKGKVAVASMIESTIPFVAPDSIDKMVARVNNITGEDGKPILSPQEARALGMASADLANRDVNNFRAQNPEAFQENSIKMMRESTGDANSKLFTDPVELTKKAMGSAGFFDGLAGRVERGEAAVFRSYEGFPPPEQMAADNKLAVEQIRKDASDMRAFAAAAGEAMEKGVKFTDGPDGPEVQKRANQIIAELPAEEIAKKATAAVQMANKIQEGVTGSVVKKDGPPPLPPKKERVVETYKDVPEPEVVKKLKASMEALPPLAEDNVRLYRGEVSPDQPKFASKIPTKGNQVVANIPPAEVNGLWHTDSMEAAVDYANRASTADKVRITYIDVPKEEAQKMMMENQDPKVQRLSRAPKEEYILPREMLEQKKIMIELSGAEIDKSKMSAGNAEWIEKVGADHDKTQNIEARRPVSKDTLPPQVEVPPVRNAQDIADNQRFRNGRGGNAGVEMTLPGEEMRIPKAPRNVVNAQATGAVSGVTATMTEAPSSKVSATTTEPVAPKAPKLPIAEPIYDAQPVHEAKPVVAPEASAPLSRSQADPDAIGGTATGNVQNALSIVQGLTNELRPGMSTTDKMINRTQIGLGLAGGYYDVAGKSLSNMGVGTTVAGGAIGIYQGGMGFARAYEAGDATGMALSAGTVSSSSLGVGATIANLAGKARYAAAASKWAAGIGAVVQTAAVGLQIADNHYQQKGWDEESKHQDELTQMNSRPAPGPDHLDDGIPTRVRITEYKQLNDLNNNYKNSGVQNNKELPDDLSKAENGALLAHMVDKIEKTNIKYAEDNRQQAKDNLVSNSNGAAQLSIWLAKTLGGGDMNQELSDDLSKAERAYVIGWNAKGASDEINGNFGEAGKKAGIRGVKERMDEYDRVMKPLEEKYPTQLAKLEQLKQMKLDISRDSTDLANRVLGYTKTSADGYEIQAKAERSAELDAVVRQGGDDALKQHFSGLTITKGANGESRYEFNYTTVDSEGNKVQHHTDHMGGMESIKAHGMKQARAKFFAEELVRQEFDREYALVKGMSQPERDAYFAGNKAFMEAAKKNGLDLDSRADVGMVSLTTSQEEFNAKMNAVRPELAVPEAKAITAKQLEAAEAIGKANHAVSGDVELMRDTAKFFSPRMGEALVRDEYGQPVMDKNGRPLSYAEVERNIGWQRGRLQAEADQFRSQIGEVNGTLTYAQQKAETMAIMKERDVAILTASKEEARSELLREGLREAVDVIEGQKGLTAAMLAETEKALRNGVQPNEQAMKDLEALQVELAQKREAFQERLDNPRNNQTYRELLAFDNAQVLKAERKIAEQSMIMVGLDPEKVQLPEKAQAQPAQIATEKKDAPAAQPSGQTEAQPGAATNKLSVSTEGSDKMGELTKAAPMDNAMLAALKDFEKGGQVASTSNSALPSKQRGLGGELTA